MVPGSGDGATVSSSPAECCALCAKTRGCNVWVACTDKWCGNQCWLKWTDTPATPTVRASGGTVPWTSGTIQKDVPGDQPEPSETELDSTRVVALSTSEGELRIRLKPEWHLPSVRFVQKQRQRDLNLRPSWTLCWHSVVLRCALQLSARPAVAGQRSATSARSSASSTARSRASCCKVRCAPSWHPTRRAASSEVGLLSALILRSGLGVQ